MVFPSVARRKPLSGTQNSPVVSEDPVNETCLTKHECLMYRCPLLWLSTPSTGPMKVTLLGHFFGCSVSCPKIDSSGLINLPVLFFTETQA